MSAYRLTPQAEDGLHRIADYVEHNFGSLVAERVVVELAAGFRRIALNASIGHRREDLTDDERVRFWSVGPSLIAYRDRGAWTEILFVEPASRDWEFLIRNHAPRLMEAATRSGSSAVRERGRESRQAAQRRAAQEEIEQEALDGLRSGEPIDVAPGFWKERRRCLARRVKSPKKS